MPLCHLDHDQPTKLAPCCPVANPLQRPTPCNALPRPRPRYRTGPAQRALTSLGPDASHTNPHLHAQPIPEAGCVHQKAFASETLFAFRFCSADAAGPARHRQRLPGQLLVAWQRVAVTGWWISVFRVSTDTRGHGEAAWEEEPRFCSAAAILLPAWPS